MGGGSSQMRNVYGYRTPDDCSRIIQSEPRLPDEEVYCPALHDGVLCWPATKANATAKLNCPPLNGLVVTNYAHRVCGPDGLWQTKETGVYTNGSGYSFYVGCYGKNALEIYKTVFLGKTQDEVELLLKVFELLRTLEIVGLSISLAATILSLVIFCHFRSLKCHRTLMHKHLFVALIVQISIKLISYIDQLLTRHIGGDVAGASSGTTNTIFDTPILCEILYSVIEYTVTVKFMWMFLEGFYLHNMIAVSVFSAKPNYIIYFIIGWGLPFQISAAWVTAMALSPDGSMRCWFGYHVNPLVWILHGPRMAIMAVNLFFLLNIIRVLVIKLRDTQTNESNKIRKAVKAAIVLLPLLGLTNFMSVLKPDYSDVMKYIIYTSVDNFLVTFEGFFISLIYCFLNGEVRLAFRNRWDHYRQHRVIHSSSARRISRSLSIFTSLSEVPPASQMTRPSNAGLNGDAPNGTAESRLASFFRGKRNRRQSSRFYTTNPRSMTELPEVPDNTAENNGIVPNCRTDLMSEEKV